MPRHPRLANRRRDAQRRGDGPASRVRYILFTDALLESLDRARSRRSPHEIAHIRRRHLPWLIASILATLWLGTSLVVWPALEWTRCSASRCSRGPDGRVTIGAAAIALAGRRGVRLRQSRVRATGRRVRAQSLSGYDTPGAESGVITEEAAHAMAGTPGGRAVQRHPDAAVLLAPRQHPRATGPRARSWELPS